MRRGIVNSLLAAVVAAVFWASMASAAMYHVDLDLSSLGIDASVTDLQVEIDLYDNYEPYDSFALFDNVILGTAQDRFEDSAVPLGGFDNSWNVLRVYRDLGTLDGTGSYLMRIEADPGFAPTIVTRDYSNRDGDVLSFDVDAVLGLGDELVLSLLDLSGAPLVGGFSPGYGDVVVIGNGGAEVVPVPGAGLLALLGFGSAGLGLRTRIARLRSLREP